MTRIFISILLCCINFCATHGGAIIRGLGEINGTVNNVVYFVELSIDLDIGTTYVLVTSGGDEVTVGAAGRTGINTVLVNNI